MIERVTPKPRPLTAARPQRGQPGGFGEVLKRELAAGGPAKPQVVFSKHAMSRVEDRRIEVTPDLLGQLADCVAMAENKGATNILAMDRTRAFIINVPSAKVITAIAQDEMRENIFTNIDGAVFLK